jgi:hypothetical protein
MSIGYSHLRRDEAAPKMGHPEFFVFSEKQILHFSTPQTKTCLWEPRAFRTTRFLKKYFHGCLERCDSCDVLADNQGVDVMGAFVGFY